MPPIHDFTITDNATGDDITQQILDDKGYTFLLVSPHLESADDTNFGDIDQLYEYCQAQGVPFYCLTASGEDAIQHWRDITGAEYPFCMSDETTLKTVIRSNPGLVLIKDGTVIRKWSHNGLPKSEELNGPLAQIEIGQMDDVSVARKIASILSWFVLPLVLLVIADRLLVAVTALCGDPEAYTGAYVFIGAVLYAAELYADFTGGIDITIGIAQVLGISVKENFIRPYFSRNIAEYWRRWHISMGTWFKDYIFYPLSVAPWLLKLSKSARKKISDGFGRKLSVYVSTIVTWFLTGLWHGAAWNFVVWGLLNAFFILLAEEFKPVSQRFRAKHEKLVSGFGYRAFETLRTFLLMCSLRVLDCYRDVTVSFRAIGTVFTDFNWREAFSGTLLQLGLTGADYIVAFCGVIVMFAVSCVQEKRGSVREALWEKPVLSYAVFFILAVAVLTLGAYGVGYDASQFIYNQF